MPGCSGSQPICDPNKTDDCQRALDQTFERLRTLEPPILYPSGEEVASYCHAEFIPSLESINNWLIRLRIKGSYPNHPSQIRRPGQNPEIIDFTKSIGPLILMGGISIFGNGDDNKWFSFESKAGFAYVSLVPILDNDIAAALKACPDFSPIREVSTVFSRDGEWSEALERVGEFTKLSGGAASHLEDISFPYHNRKSRYWGAWMKGATEVETMIVGGMPTHVPSEKEGDPFATKQCELGPWYQVYEYEHRPMVTLDGGPQGFPRDTKYICVRALESEPTPFMQTMVSVKGLAERGSVLLAHDATNPRRVRVQYGPTEAEQLQARQNSLFTLTLEWRPMVDAVLWDVGGVISDQSLFWEKRDDLAKKFGVPVKKLVQYSDEHRKEVDLGQMPEEAFWRSALIFAGVSPARLKNPGGYAGLWPYVHPIEGTVEIMEALTKRKITQGILSNDSKELGELKRQKLYPQIFDDSKSIVLSGELGIIKPDPKIYKEALRRLQMENKPERVLFIDDKEKYCKGARDLGMRCIVFQDARQLREELRKLGFSLP